MDRFEQRREAKLKELRRCKPLVAGSLCKVKRRCGNPNCKCAKGEPHEAHVLSFKVKGKTKTVHVPKDQVEEVRQWVQENKRIKRLMQEISKLGVTMIQRHVPTRRAAEKGKKSLSR